ncbi:hypothetical protein BH10ACT1_BH10ACT1_16670 [soil metagenome]
MGTAETSSTLPSRPRPVVAAADAGPWAVGLALVAAGLAVVGGVVASGSPRGLTAGWIVALVLLSTWVVAGLSLLHRACPLGRLALLGVGVAAVGFAGAAERAAGRGWAADLALVVGVAGLPAVVLHLLAGLPDGFLDSRARRALVGGGHAVAAAVAVGWWASGRGGLGWWLAAESVVLVAVGVGPANLRYRATAGLARQRLQWIGCAVTVAAEVSLVALACRVLAGWPHHTLLVAAAASITVPLALIASSTPLVSRVDRLLVATVSTIGLTGVVVGVYVLVVVGLGRTATGDERQLLILSMLAAAVAVLLYVPARARLTELANRLVYGERHAPDESIKTFGSRLSRAVPMDELLLQLAESLKKTMALTSAEVWTGSEGRYDLAVSVPDRPAASLRIEPSALDVVARAGVSGTAWVGVWLPQLLEGREGQQLRVVPVSHSGELLGLFVLDRPEDADAFDEQEDGALAELVRQVGLALHNVQLDSALQASLDDVRRYAGELQASRARIVATGDAERRKIERNLHDGAQQHLVALAVNLRLVGDLIQDDPGAAGEMMSMLADSVKDTIQELRDLAHGIYPPLLMDSGLPEALPAAAARSPLDVRAEVAPGRYPTEVEAAVYFCCLEALQNAAKHAPGATVDLRVWADAAEHRLHFSVVDDGPGFDATLVAAGHGHVNMSDRLGAIGGSVTWTSEPGAGATIAGWVPVG